MFCLAIAPFHDIERGYYKSSAAVYVLIAALALAGRLGLWWSSDGAGGAGRVAEIGVWAIFVGCAGAYLASLWGERVALRPSLHRHLRAGSRPSSAWRGCATPRCCRWAVVFPFACGPPSSAGGDRDAARALVSHRSGSLRALRRTWPLSR
jgi:hypothetical protein